jgi:tetratricopeptide (TPR) repeat protein
MQDASQARDRGVQLFREGQYAEAALYLRQARDAAPSDLAVHFHLGAALFQLGRHQEAVASFEEAIRIDPQSPQAHFNLAQAYLNLGRPTEAQAELQTVQQLKPDYPGLGDWLTQAAQAAAQAAAEAAQAAQVAQAPAPQPTQPLAAAPQPPGQTYTLESPLPPQPVPMYQPATAPAEEEAWYSEEELAKAERRETTMLNRGKAICSIVWAPGVYFLFAIFSAVAGMFLALPVVLVILIPLVYLVIMDAYDFMAINPKLMVYIGIAGVCFSAGMFIWALQFGLFEK